MENVVFGSECGLDNIRVTVLHIVHALKFLSCAIKDSPATQTIKKVSVPSMRWQYPSGTFPKPWQRRPISLVNDWFQLLAYLGWLHS